MPPRPIERKIYFYRANVGSDDGGRPLRFTPTAALQHIDGLPFSAEVGRYLDDGDARLCCWVDSANPRQHVRFGYIRRFGLPLVEQQGTLTDLSIPTNSGLAEVTHIVVFDNNIIGADFNFYGPRISGFARYLRARGNRWYPDVTFEPLMRRDVTVELDRLRDITLFHLKIRAAYAATVAEADSDLGAAFEAAARAGNAEELELVLRPRRYSRKPLTGMLDVVRDLVRRPDLRTEASKFLVKGVRVDTGAVAPVDVLRDQLVTTESIMRQTERGRALDHPSAYEAIEKAFGDLEDDLIMAAGLVL